MKIVITSQNLESGYNSLLEGYMLLSWIQGMNVLL